MNIRAYARKFLKTHYKFNTDQITSEKAVDTILSLVSKAKHMKDNLLNKNVDSWLIKYMLNMPLTGIISKDEIYDFDQLLIAANKPKNFNGEL